MTANVKAIRTEAETALLEAFETSKASLPGARAERQAAIETFARLGLPHRRIESWHYTDLRSAMRTASPVVAHETDRLDEVAPDALTKGARLVVLDGVFRPDLSDFDALPAKVVVRPLHDSLQLEGALAAALPADAAAAGDPVVALNTALMQDGVVIEVTPGAKIAEPVVLVNALSGRGAQAAFTRSVLRVGEGASITLVEDCRALNAAATQSNETLIVEVADTASVRHVARVNYPGAASIHLHSLIVSQAKSSQVDSFCLVVDGGLVRRQIFAKLAGEHATLALSGLSLLDGARLADTTLVVDHAVPHGTSREFYRHILEGEATGVYQGKVVVRPHAQKTDGGMRSNALVLSDGASMNNKPELEIFADDVVCGHGATVGQLDEDQLFYLMARGIPRIEAEALLVEAFGTEVIEKVADETLREALMTDLQAWLARREGRA